jgi:hypothetical protein
VIVLAASETTGRMHVCDRMIAFPDHALLIVEERLKEQEAEGVRMPERMPLDELALNLDSRRGTPDSAFRALAARPPTPRPRQEDAWLSERAEM